MLEARFENATARRQPLFAAHVCGPSKQIFGAEKQDCITLALIPDLKKWGRDGATIMRAAPLSFRAKGDKRQLPYARRQGSSFSFNMSKSDTIIFNCPRCEAE